MCRLDLLQVELQFVLEFKNVALMLTLHLQHVFLLQSVHTQVILAAFQPDNHTISHPPSFTDTDITVLLESSVLLVRVQCCCYRFTTCALHVCII